MEIDVKKASGILRINSAYIINFIYDQVGMVPGIYSIGKEGIVNKLKRMINYKEDAIKITPLGPGVIGIEIHVILKKGVNFKTIATQVQDILIFSIKEKYGVEVNFVDVIIEGTE